MTVGSGLASKIRGLKSHLTLGGGGVAGEVGDLRQDVVNALTPLAAVAAEEFTNLVGTAAPGAATLLAATATVASIVTVLPASLLAAGLAMLAAWPRQLTFTTAGTTAADVPANVVINGLNEYGVAVSETLVLSQTAAAVTSVNYFSSITSIVYPAADGTGGTVAIGIAAAVVKKATAMTVALKTLTPRDIIQTDLARNPRQLVFTTAGGTPADAPANVVITGRDINGNVQSETLALAQTAASATSLKYYASIDTLAFAAADGAGSTVAITFNNTTVGLRKKLLARAGLAALEREIVDGTVVTTGAVTAAASALPNGAYTPATAPNDVHDYYIRYEFDATA
jgi:hypothetical protein